MKYCINYSNEKCLIAVLLCHSIESYNLRMSILKRVIKNSISVQVIKMYAWEKPFEKIVKAARSIEIKKIGNTSYVRAVYLALMVFTNRIILFLTLLSYVLLGYNLRPEITFMLSSYFEILQLTTTLFFPQALLMAGETLVSIKRLEVVRNITTIQLF